jgi:hypothetical protein
MLRVSRVLCVGCSGGSVLLQLVVVIGDRAVVLLILWCALVARAVRWAVLSRCWSRCHAAVLCGVVVRGAAVVLLCYSVLRLCCCAWCFRCCCVVCSSGFNVVGISHQQLNILRSFSDLRSHHHQEKIVTVTHKNTV